MSEFTSRRKISIADVMSALSETISMQRGAGTSEDPTPTELFVLISITLAAGGAVEHLSKVLKIYRYHLFRCPKLFPPFHFSLS